MTFKERAIKCARRFGWNMLWTIAALVAAAVIVGIAFLVANFARWLDAQFGELLGAAFLVGVVATTWSAMWAAIECRRD